jgi:hypothetical protein
MDDDTDADDSNDDRAPSLPIALASRGIPPRRRRVLPSRRCVRGQISNYQLFSSHMHNQHFPSRLSPRSVVNARKCFKKPPNACMPSVDGHPAHRRVDSARYRCDYTFPNVKSLYCLPIQKQTQKNKAKINPNLFKRRRRERTNGRTNVRRTEDTCSARRRRRRRRRRASSRLADASCTVGVVGVVGRASKRRCQSVLGGRDDGTRTRATRGRRRGRRRGGPRRC